MTHTGQPDNCATGRIRLGWFAVLPVLFFHLLLYCNPAWAHELRPGFIQLEETAAGQYAAQWRYPTSIPAAALPGLKFPAACTPVTAARMERYDDAYIGNQDYRCNPGLAGQALRLVYPVMNPSITSLVRLSTLDGGVLNHVMKPGDTTWQVPAQPAFREVAGDYLVLGMEHILRGWDHLLFVACLILIARTPRRTLLTITGFTLAHSITLALSTLDLVALPVVPVEACIALSIMILAHEIIVHEHGSWTWDHPVLVSSSFGLLHGFGFAAVLRGIGLPQGDLPAALLFFNLGVEVGQILFVLAFAAVLVLTVRLQHTAGLLHRYRGRLQKCFVYLAGTVAAFWFIQRLAGFG